MNDANKHAAFAPFAQHRHPRCVTPAAGSAIVRDDTAVIADLRRQLAAVEGKLAEVTSDRDGLLLAIARITEALGLPEGHDLDKVIRRIEELA